MFVETVIISFFLFFFEMSREARPAHVHVCTTPVSLMHQGVTVLGEKDNCLTPNTLPPLNDSPMMASKPPPVLPGASQTPAGASVPAISQPGDAFTPDESPRLPSGEEEPEYRPSPAKLEILRLREVRCVCWPVCFSANCVCEREALVCVCSFDYGTRCAPIAMSCNGSM